MVFKRMRLFLIVSSILIVAVGSVYIWLLLTQPNYGVITATPINTTYAKPAAPTEPTLIKGEYARFSVPVGFHAVDVDQAVPPVVERYSFVRTGLDPKTIGITISSLPSGNLADDSAYNYRSRSPDYSETVETTESGAPYAVMTSTTTDGFDKTAFLTHNGYLAAVNINSASVSNTSELTTMFIELMDTWAWVAR